MSYLFPMRRSRPERNLAAAWTADASTNTERERAQGPSRRTRPPHYATVSASRPPRSSGSSSGIRGQRRERTSQSEPSSPRQHQFLGASNDEHDTQGSQFDQHSGRRSSNHGTQTRDYVHSTVANLYDSSLPQSPALSLAGIAAATQQWSRIDSLTAQPFSRGTGISERGAQRRPHHKTPLATSRPEQGRSMSGQAFSAISVDDNTKEFDFMYGTSFCEQVKNEQNIEFVCEMLKEMRLRDSYGLRNIASGLRWLVSNWTIKNAAIVVSRITKDWSIVDVAKLTSLLSEDWPLDPHTLLFSKSLLNGRTASVAAEYCAVVTQKWSVPATMRMAKDIALNMEVDPKLFIRQVGFELLIKSGNGNAKFNINAGQTGVLARVNAMTRLFLFSAPAQRISKKQRGCESKCDKDSYNSDVEDEDEESRDTLGALPSFSRKGRSGIPLSDLKTRKQFQRRASQSYFSASDLRVGGLKSVSRRKRSKTC